MTRALLPAAPAQLMRLARKYNVQMPQVTVHYNNLTVEVRPGQPGRGYQGFIRVKLKPLKPNNLQVKVRLGQPWQGL